jgi:hypothetical protein
VLFWGSICLSIGKFFRDKSIIANSLEPGETTRKKPINEKKTLTNEFVKLVVENRRANASHTQKFKHYYITVAGICGKPTTSCSVS